MSPRAIRRAAERQAKKQASKSLHVVAPELPAVPEEACSQSRLEANRLNSLFSTGPRSLQGKSISSLNAVKTGLTGRTVLLPSDDAVAYQRHIEEYEQEFKPAGLRERELVQSLADTQWRLKRIPGLEMAIYSQGRVEFEDSFDEHHPDLRSSMIELQTFLKYEKQLRNLQLQESRLHRRYEKESAELRRLQKITEPRTSVSGALQNSTEPCTSGVRSTSASAPSKRDEAGPQPADMPVMQPYELLPAPTPQPEVGFEFSNSSNPRLSAFIGGQKNTASPRHIAPLVAIMKETV